LVSDEISRSDDQASRGHTSTPTAAATEERLAFDRLIGDLRPKLHRYCARMTGSVVDGEDVLQEALLKAIDAFNPAEPVANPEGWLFRIAHNAALDFLRRRAARSATTFITMIGSTTGNSFPGWSTDGRRCWCARPVIPLPSRPISSC
jgi:DNA-directed RNA polymerase specialized sigma24 family protein